MSRWLPDRLQFTLAPDSVSVARMPHRLRPGAGSAQATAGEPFPVSPLGAEAPVWQGALETLAEVVRGLDCHGARRARATAILSNHFVRYALMPKSELIDDDEEEVSLARHCLREVYGTAADRWEVRMDPDRHGPAKLVSAVEPELLAQLRGIFAASSTRLVSIQPRLMAVCNRHRQHFGDRDAWLALAEAGSLCLALLRGGAIVRLRHVRLGSAWADELVTALERESLLADSDAAIREVFLIAGDLPEPQFPAGLAWHIQSLEPPVARDSATSAWPPALAAGA